MKIALLVLSALFVAATVLPLWRTSRWWVRMFDFPRLQLVVFGAALLAGWVTAGPGRSVVQSVALGLVVASLVYQLVRISRYTPLWRHEVARVGTGDSIRLRVCVTNVLMESDDYARWAEVILPQQADIVLAVETDQSWVDAIVQRADDYPHRVVLPQNNTYGMLLLSKLPIIDSEVRHISDERVPSIWATLRLSDGRKLYFVGLHPRPPRPEHGFDAHLRDAELVLAARALRERSDDTPTVVAGDLNDVAWSDSTRLFQRLSGLLDVRVGRGLFSSFHAQRWWMRWPLDHVFVSPDFTYVAMRLLADTGSDHFPVCAELALHPVEQGENEEVAADGEDAEEARDVVREAAEVEENLSPEDKSERDELDR